MSEIRLWPADLEPLRAESRAVTDAALPVFADLLGPPEMPTAQRLLHQRKGMEGLAAPVTGPMPEAGERTIAGVRCRTFVPDTPPTAVYLQIHGGGMCLGFPEQSDADNLRLCRELALVVVSPDYGLGPERPYPAAYDDAFAVASWLLTHAGAEWGTGSRILAGGESAGASIAAATALRIRDELGAVDRVAGLNLVYGAYDFSGAIPSTAGVRATDNGDCLDVPGLRMLRENWLPGLSDEEIRDPRISPLHADLRGFPRALLTIGVDDHALDHSLFFANRLAAAGGSAELAVYPDSMHGFLGLPTRMAARARERIDEFLRSCLTGR